jgi:hypothetical protein
MAHMVFVALTTKELPVAKLNQPVEFYFDLLEKAVRFELEFFLINQ